jgi:hypothetical protein
MQQLRESGVYTLPESEELIVHAVFRGGYVLFTPEAWEYNGQHKYESDTTGRINLNGRPTRWRVGHLADTGRTARSRSRSGAAQKAFSG